MSELPQKYLALGEDGHPLINEVRVSDPTTAISILENLKVAENGAIETDISGDRYLVEAFDEPLIAVEILEPVTSLDSPAKTVKTSKMWCLVAPFGVRKSFSLDTLRLDEWDRFHGLTDQNVPFVMTKKAQGAFFDLLENFDDESITYAGKKFQVASLYSSEAPVETESFWTEIYKTELPRWDLGQPSPALMDLLPRLKMPKTRVLILGCGYGHDAAYFAQQGHLVTAVDISPEALRGAREKYGHLKNLTFVEGDLFQLNQDWHGQFDLIFEHTCFCAIPPEKRQDLVKQWLKFLSPQGQLLGIFFTFFSVEKRHLPPFGASEWELRKRLQKNFQFLFWGRWRQSIERRNGKELLIFANRAPS